jgi:hypothetical protein
MSGPAFQGAPVQRSQSRGQTARSFSHIPRLREVLAHGGWPGAIYAQVCIHNLKAARERTERPARLDELHGGQVYYTISGPKGQAQVALVGTGDVIPGGNPESGNRLFFTDGEIGQLTGHKIQYPIWLRPQPEEESDAGREEVESAQGRDGDAGVRARKAPQRVKIGARGHQLRASQGDRDERSRPKQASEKQLAARRAASERFKAMHAARRGS